MIAGKASLHFKLYGRVFLLIHRLKCIHFRKIIPITAISASVFRESVFCIQMFS